MKRTTSLFSQLFGISVLLAGILLLGEFGDGGRERPRRPWEFDEPPPLETIAGVITAPAPDGGWKITRRDSSVVTLSRSDCERLKVPTSDVVDIMDLSRLYDASIPAPE